MFKFVLLQNSSVVCKQNVEFKTFKNSNLLCTRASCFFYFGAQNYLHEFSVVGLYI